MVDLPDPMTPADCDLRDFPYMPLDVVRLRDSDLAALSSGDEFRCAVLLWCASWHQVPAASLPDDDAVLSQFAGFGRVIREWKKVRNGALRGWVKCNDKRLYHPVVADKARESWRSKQAHAYSKLSERVRKANKQRVEKGLPERVLPDLDGWISAGRLLERDLFPPEKCGFPPERRNGSTVIPWKDNGVSVGITPENALKGEVRERERDISEELKKASSGGESGAEKNEKPPSAADAAAPQNPRGTRLSEGWVLPKPWGDWALSEFSAWTPETVRLEAARFADYWHAKAGKDAVKLDWLATWRNWCRNARNVSGGAQTVNRQEAIENQNRAVAQRWLQKNGATQ